MVMPYYAGVTLGRTLKQRKGPPDEAWLRHLMEHLLNALEQMHEARCYHRDISPDNILIQPDGRPLLLDFGAARRVIGDMQRALTVILKTGYAPVEQYGEMPEMKQGAWTDLYALGSVMHYAIAGQTPPPAVQRFLSDKYVPLAQLAAARYSQGFLQAIDRSLAVQPQDRPQSAAEMRALLALPAPAAGPTPAPWSPPATAADTAARSTREPTLGNASPATASRREPSFATSMFTISGSAAATVAAPLDLSLPTQAPATGRPAVPSQDHRGRRTLALAGAAVAAAVAASVGLVYLLVEFTASPPESSATVRYRTHDEDNTAVTTETAGAGTAPAPLESASTPARVQTQAGGLTAPASGGAAETLGASGTSTAPLDDPAPADVAVQAAATPTPAPAEPAPVVARVTRSTAADRRPVTTSTARASQSRRCIDIIQRVSLGEPLTTEEKDILKQECGQ
jgi:hypothetical protein